MFFHVLLVFLNILLCQAKKHKSEEQLDGEYGDNLVTSLRNDANLDLSNDEEYEDLRAEFLAYHSALASLSSNKNMRRSMLSTPCWELGGICVDYKLCTGFRFLTEVPGCKDKLRVCCFAWNEFKVKDWRDKGLGNLALPWSRQIEFGGRGVVEKEPEIKKKKKDRKKKMESEPVMILENEKHDNYNEYGLRGNNDMKLQLNSLVQQKGNKGKILKKSNDTKSIALILSANK